MNWKRIKAGEYRAGAWVVRRFVSPPNARGARERTWEVWHKGSSLFGCRDSLVAGKAFALALSDVHGRD